ncbi:peptide-methionine (R)-S-oxide reductase MsrB [Mangrovimonas sp. YM274]|uniref:peptide-methionine (R)-S-oxide reductase MsrB n=1 Tax=Mangrovimonas sp. YM274 TaxID=3070660 RepID=UPI0027DE93F5|nr:peptide-methionine (R)-S-oxide reductase MsrB [Mangrovimonas sp. YM274]WMI68540.1 peptide-methionine (R)-S-oxide reductase MsrB [Mangrovimonas sp. YM274]
MLYWKDIMHFVVHGNLEPNCRVEKTEDEWRKQLTWEEFRITRKHVTETPGTGELCHMYEEGKYQCVCCGVLLFDASGKFKSNTGWPSFTQPAQPNAIKYVKDNSLGMLRVEILCNTCDAHLGHVFPDGPEPSGLRYCVNSAALQMIKESEHE